MNHILTTYALPELILLLSMCFFFIYVPKRAALRGYRMARRMMGCCYLLYFASMLLEILGTGGVPPIMLSQLLRAAVGIYQAFFFTFALMALIDVRFFTWRRFAYEALLIAQPVLLAFCAYFFIPSSTPILYQYIPFVCLALFYAYKLVDYVRHFQHHYREYERRMANYFSDDESERLKWVQRAFYMALGIGVFAMIYALFPSALMDLVFMLAVVAYYSAFGVRFINYAFMFHKIEVPLLSSEVDESGHEQEVSSALRDEQAALMQRIHTLMVHERLYTNPGLAVEDVAVQVGASLRAVSTAINTCQDTNFKSWVNAYRVEEAVRLISAGFLSNHTTDALAIAVGFANRVSFYRVFKKVTGKSPTDY